MNIDIIYQIFMALAGLGVLLYGIRLMNSSLESVLGYRFKHTLGKVSNSVVKNYGIGAGTTFLVQTSVLTITMTTGLINIGAIGLAQGLILTIGANFGSACSMILLAFESFNILKICSLFCLVGMIILVFAKKPKTEIVGKTILGFGLLCLGITLLSSSMEQLTNLIDMKALFTSISNPFVLILFGILFAILMQSAYPVTAILITLVSAGVMGFEGACFAIFGASIGATISILFLTGFGDGQGGRKIVVFNLLLKIFSTILFGLLMLIPAWAGWIHNTLCGGMASFSLVVMVILFNFVPGILLLPFINLIAKFMNLIIKQNGKKKNSEYEQFQIDEHVLNNPAIACRAVKDNIAKILNMEIELNETLCLMLFSKTKFVSQKGKIRALEKAIKLTTNNVIRLGGKYSDENLEKIQVFLNILNDTTQILKVNTRFDDFAKLVEEKPRSLLGFQAVVLKQLGEDINDLGKKVFGLLNEPSGEKNKTEELKVIFEINDINIGNNTKAKHELLDGSKENKNRDNGLYFNLLYEFGKLETDYTDIAIKITLMEE